MLGFSTIIKLTMGLIVIIVVFGIVHTLFPNAMQSFSNSTHIEFPTFSLGKEKQEFDFEITNNIKGNIKMINESIISQNLVTDLTLNNFDGSTLTIGNKNGKLRMIVNFGDKTKIYDENIKYNPCIIKIDTKKLEEKTSELANEFSPKKIPMTEYHKALIESSKISKVSKIIFINRDTFKVDDDDEKYTFYPNLIKTEDSNHCFACYGN